MKILTKYLIKSLLFPLLYCLFGFILIFIVNDLFDNFTDFIDWGTKPLDFLYYYALLIPPVLVQIFPVCLLLGMLYSLSRLTRHNEIVAMRAGGISIYRIIMPFLGMGLLLVLITGAINELIAPNAAYYAKQFLEYQNQHHDEETYFAKDLALKSGSDVWMIQRLDTRDQSMYDVELIQQRPDGTDEVKYQAGKAVWLDGHWWFMDVTVQQYNEKGDLLGAPEMVLQKEMRELKETPQTFMIEIKDPQYLSASEIVQYLKTKKTISDNSRARLKVDFHSRLAAPVICLIVTMIGIPVGAHTGRRGAFAGIMMALSFFFVFFALQLVFQALGKQGKITPWIGGWMPLIIFGSFSPVLIYRMR